MICVKRSKLSTTEKNYIWSRWKAGQSLHEIGRAFDKPHSCIRSVLLPRGGIPPAARRRSRLALTLAEREDISRGIPSGLSIREIARHLDRAASTVSREISRHGGRPAYRAHEADGQAWESALRPKRCLLALHRRMRRSRHASASGQSRGQIVDAVSIRERPGEVEDRAVPGHWEGDLLAGAKNTYIATLVERHSRFAMLIKVPSKNTEVVVAALSQHVRKLPATLKRSLTWDRGLEMAKHKDFTVATDVQVYFCDRRVPGNAAPTKTRISCCGNISREEPTCLSIPKRNSTRSRCG